MNAPAQRWWIEAQDRVWGPYPAERLAVFREEGRLGAASLVGADPAGPFAPAALVAELSALFGDLDGAEDRAQPDPEEPAPAKPAPERRAAATPARRPLLVLTDAQDPARRDLETALGAYGETVRVRPGLWLVRAREGAAALRNALSRRLRGADMLLVVEAPLAAAAWFNLDGATDRGLRRLWAEAGATPPRPDDARSPG